MAAPLHRPQRVHSVTWGRAPPRPLGGALQHGTVLVRARTQALEELRDIDGDRSARPSARRRKGRRQDGKTYPDWTRPKGSCPCCSGRQYKECCAPFVKGEAWPETAEALMRSRFAAYVQHRASWLRASTHPSNSGLKGSWRNGVQESTYEQDCEATFRTAAWFRLRIADTRPGRDEDEAFVTFHAWFKVLGQKLDHRGVDAKPMQTFSETSRFVREDRRWLYVDAVEVSEEALPFE